MLHFWVGAQSPKNAGLTQTRIFRPDPNRTRRSKTRPDPTMTLKKLDLRVKTIIILVSMFSCTHKELSFYLAIGFCLIC